MRLARRRRLVTTCRPPSSRCGSASTSRLLLDADLHARVRHLHADARQRRIPVLAPVVEQRLRRLAADVARLAGLLGVQRERVRLLERRTARRRSGSARATACRRAGRSPRVGVDRQDSPSPGCSLVVVVRERRVPVGDQQAVLVREVLDPVRPVREAEVVRPGLQVAVERRVRPVRRDVVVVVAASTASRRRRVKPFARPAVVAVLGAVGEHASARRGELDLVERRCPAARVGVCCPAAAPSVGSGSAARPSCRRRPTGRTWPAPSRLLTPSMPLPSAALVIEPGIAL